MSDSRSARGFLYDPLEHQGRTTPWVTYVPAEYEAESDGPAWPLLIYLHGRGEEGRDGWKQVAVGLGPAILLEPDRWPFLALFPQKPADRHGWTEHEWRIMKPLQQVRERYRVDPRRIYLTGVSMGGFGCWMLAPEHRDLFAAIAPVCGGGRPEEAQRIADLPIWAFHGEADAVVGVEHTRRMVEAVRDAGGEPRLTTYPGVGHNSWDRAYREETIPDWLLAQQLPEPLLPSDARPDQRQRAEERA